MGKYQKWNDWIMWLVVQSCPTPCEPIECSPPGSSVHGDFPGKNTGVGCHFLLQGNLPHPGIQARSPTLQLNSLLSEPRGKLMCLGHQFSSVQFSCSVVSNSLRPHGLQHARLPWVIECKKLPKCFLK